jgi:hypothetical protein
MELVRTTLRTPASVPMMNNTPTMIAVFLLAFNWSLLV